MLNSVIDNQPLNWIIQGIKKYYYFSWFLNCKKIILLPLGMKISHFVLVEFILFTGKMHKYV